MLSINTNLSSLIAQSSLQNSTLNLNQAVERMSTGYKINHAKDNAANYSISTNLTTRIGAYQVAEENCAMGMDLVNTASSTIAEMQSHAERLRALIIQARSGTYGAQSLNAIQSEANARISEIVRLHQTAEYNDISLFDRMAYTIASHLPQAGASGFIDETAFIATTADTPESKAEYNGFIENPVSKTQAEVEALASIDTFTSGAGGEYKIMSADDLAKLAAIVNSADNDTTGAKFYLGADIDMTEWHSINGKWTPIGNYSENISYQFTGTFDGNGHTISNLEVGDGTANFQGLFGRTALGSTIKNIGLKGGTVKGKDYTGGLVGYSYSTISNSYATGSVSGTGNYTGGLVGSSVYSTISSYATGSVSGTGNQTGGLVGYSSSTITNSYATGSVCGTGNHTGGLVGYSSSGSITNSYATGSVSGTGNYTGGLVGYSSSGSITNSYATGAVSGISYTGGLVGYSSSGSITNSYATGSVSGTSNTGGLVGYSSSGSITNSYATGSVSGTGNNTGGLAGISTGTISNSYATGSVNGTGKYTGGLVGQSASSSTISNSYATGSVSGNTFVGGLVGLVYKTSGTAPISNCTSYSTVTGVDSNSTGSLIGGASLTTNGTSFGTLNITGTESVSQDMNTIGGVYKYASSTNTLLPDYDMTTMLSGISEVAIQQASTNLQVGVNGDSSCQLNFDTNFSFDISALSVDISSNSALGTIDEFINLLSNKQTELGAVQNRLESALDEISIQLENLVSSRSTIRDADIGEVSAQYIQQQILQQAAATLLATANQTPSIALQLL